MDEQQIADAKLANVEHQITLMERSEHFISCPYCLRVSGQGEVIECCKAMDDAVKAVLYRKFVARSLDKADQIAQKNVTLN